MQGPEVIVPIVMFASIAIVVIFLRKFSNEERMALIEKGADAKIFKTGFSKSFASLRTGLLLIGAGVGLLIGAILAESSGLDEEVSYFSMLFIFGGSGLLAAYFLEQRRLEKDHSDD